MGRTGNTSLHMCASVMLLSSMLLCCSASAFAEGLFFSSGGSIEACDLDGSNRRPLVGFSGDANSLVDVTVEPVSQDVWWAFYESATDEVVFQRMTPTAKLPEEILRVSGGSDFRAFAVDGVANKIGNY